MSYEIILIGGGGHAKVLLDAYTENKIIGYTDKKETDIAKLFSINYIGSDKEINSFPHDSIKLLLGIGSVWENKQRAEIFNHWTQQNYVFENAIHPSAIISSKSKIGSGVQIMAGSIVQTNCEIKNNVIINTGAQIDHDTIIHNHTHIAPGVVCSGTVEIKENTFIGAGTTIIQNVKIGKNVKVAAGSIITESIPNNTIVKGLW